MLMVRIKPLPQFQEKFTISAQCQLNQSCYQPVYYQQHVQSSYNTSLTKVAVRKQIIYHYADYKKVSKDKRKYS